MICCSYCNFLNALHYFILKFTLNSDCSQNAENFVKNDALYLGPFPILLIRRSIFPTKITLSYS